MAACWEALKVVVITIRSYSDLFEPPMWTARLSWVLLNWLMPSALIMLWGSELTGCTHRDKKFLRICRRDLFLKILQLWPRWFKHLLLHCARVCSAWAIFAVNEWSSNESADGRNLLSELWAGSSYPVLPMCCDATLPWCVNRIVSGSEYFNRLKLWNSSDPPSFVEQYLLVLLHMTVIMILVDLKIQTVILATVGRDAHMLLLPWRAHWLKLRVSCGTAQARWNILQWLQKSLRLRSKYIQSPLFIVLHSVHGGWGDYKAEGT